MRKSGITKPTIKKYIEYLESAFLIIKLSTVNDNCKTGERNFKVYLNNPSMRAALFAPVQSDDGTMIGHLAGSAIFSQWQHSPAFRQLRYARWRNEGEVDIAYLDEPNSQPRWIGEIKCSDRVATRREEETRSMAFLLRKHRQIRRAVFTTRSVSDEFVIEGRPVKVTPSALYCYTVGRNIMARLDELMVDEAEEAAD